MQLPDLTTHPAGCKKDKVGSPVCSPDILFLPIYSSTQTPASDPTKNYCGLRCTHGSFAFHLGQQWGMHLEPMLNAMQTSEIFLATRIMRLLVMSGHVLAAPGDANPNLLQYRAAHYLRKAENAGVKTLGNSW